MSGDRQPIVIGNYMKQLSEVVETAKDAGKFNDANGVRLKADQADALASNLIASAAKQYMDGVHLKSIPPNEESNIAQAFITAHEWKKAKVHLDISLSADSGVSSLVNDRLRYARCLANLGDVDGAIRWARETFSAPPVAKWPILYAVYLEIVPAAVALKPSARLELAQLVQDAISQHLQAVGNHSLFNETDIAAQERLLYARTHHIEKAWDLVIKLYNDANRPDLAKAAATEKVASVKESRNLSVQVGS